MTKAEKLKRVITEGTPAERKYIFEQSPKLFAYYYFTNYFQYEPAPFHEDMWTDGKELMDLDITDLMWEMFRESAKSSIFQIIVIHGICYRKFKWGNWSSYAKANAENALFDIGIELQTNSRLKTDFGELYSGGLKKSSEKTRNRLDDFITLEVRDSEGDLLIPSVRLTAYSTQESWRGRKWTTDGTVVRPDLAVFDDFENEITMESAAITSKVIENIEAAKAGMAPSARRVYLCNGISDTGSVEYTKQLLRDNPKARVRSIPVEKDGEILWTGKYVHTDAEAAASHKDPQKRKVSLETKKRELKNYDAEMLNNPYSAEDLFFNRIKVKKAYELTRKPTAINAGLYIFEEFRPLHRYAVGADVSEGTGRDHSASVVIDFERGEVVGSFIDNKIAPDRFADELHRQSGIYGNCLIAPERNSIGVATVIRLADLDANLFVDHKHGQIGDPVTKKYGWRTTKESKANMLFAFKKAFEDGKLKIYDERLLDEMKTYTRSDFLETSSLVTKHYDLLIAACIAWQMSEHAPMPDMEDDEWDNDYQANSAI